MTRLLLPTFVCTRLDSSSDSSVLLEQIGSKCVYVEREDCFFQMKINNHANDYEEKSWPAYKNLEEPSIQNNGVIPLLSTHGKNPKKLV